MIPAPVLFGSRPLSFDTPLLMGIVNVTPDSFSDGNNLPTVDAAVAHAEALVEAGATIVDIGGESTRPGAASVDLATELQRVLPVVDALVQRNCPALLSIDTGKAAVARAALARGAHLINDVTALADPDMAPVVVEANAVIILMHMQGEPRTMQQNPSYGNVVSDVVAALRTSLRRATAAGIAPERVWLDPGIGFGKTVQHNLTLTKHLQDLADLGRPIVYGASRKWFLGQLTGQQPMARDAATAAVCTAAVLAGAHVLRVHNVAMVRDAMVVATAIRNTA